MQGKCPRGHPLCQRFSPEIFLFPFCDRCIRLFGLISVRPILLYSASARIGRRCRICRICRRNTPCNGNRACLRDTPQTPRSKPAIQTHCQFCLSSHERLAGCLPCKSHTGVEPVASCVQRLPHSALGLVVQFAPGGDFVEGSPAAFAPAGGRVHAAHAGAGAGNRCRGGKVGGPLGVTARRVVHGLLETSTLTHERRRRTLRPSPPHARALTPALTPSRR
jgi:hypothetical protein